jgi:glycosyltransferase involved in cell wall biosynthesis
MRIGMISYDMQDFGGLEEYAVNLAIGLKQQGHAVSYLSAAAVPLENQYSHRLRANNIPLFQPPPWISKPASDWPTKEKILRMVMWFFSPITFLLGVISAIFGRHSLKQSLTSAHNFLKGQLMSRVIGHDYRKVLGSILLTWWRVRWRPDILHIQGYTTTLLFAIDWAHVNHLAVVYEEHQTPDPQFNWWKGFEHTINKADRAIAVSEKSAQGLREVCGVTRPIVVRGPLLSDPFASGWKKDNKLQNGNGIVITTLARLYVTKGLTYLLDTAALVKKTYPNVEFKVYGEGKLREELMAKAASLGLDGEKIFMGAFTTREELIRIMTNTDIFLLPSVLEGQPLVVVEAMAFGCPIVTTNVGGIPELIQDNVNGFLCPPQSPGCLADKIKLMIDDPALRQRLGDAARKSYEQSPFQPRAVSSYFIAVYSEVLEERKKSKLSKQ